MMHVCEVYRVVSGHPLATKPDSGNDGLFMVTIGRRELKVIASDGGGWEHVSISLPDRCPKWEEMSRIKRMFWDKDDVVMQLHVADSNHINMHPYCLHLWRPIDGRTIPIPPSYMV